MFYLALQTAALLSLCAVIFFGIGWMAKRWLDSVSPWRHREFEPRDVGDATGATAVTALQASLKQVSDELSSRNISLQATKQSLQETERKWVDANQKIVALEKALEEHLERQEQFDQERGQLKQALQAAEQAAANAAVSVVPLETPAENLTPIAINPPAEEGIANALREQMKNLEARNEELRDEVQRARDEITAQQRIIDDLNQNHGRRTDPVSRLDMMPTLSEAHAEEDKLQAEEAAREQLWGPESKAFEEQQQTFAAEQERFESEKQALARDREEVELQRASLAFEREQLREQVNSIESVRDRFEDDRKQWESTLHEFEMEKARFEASKADWERGKATLNMEQQALAADRRRLEEDWSALQAETVALEQQKQESLNRRQLEDQQAASSTELSTEREQWMERIDEWEKQLSEPNLIVAPVLKIAEPHLDLEPIDKSIEADRRQIEELHKVLEAERAAFEAQKQSQTTERRDNLEEDLKKRLMVLEETLHNLKADSEMAILAQMEFQSRAMENESEERRRWDDLEHELELRITQLEHELQGVRQAEQIVSQLGEQVEEKLKLQLSELANEVSEIKSTWNNQEVEFKQRDEQILGNLDKLQSSLSKLGIKIAEEDSIPDSMLKEMEELRGDILAASSTELDVVIAPDTSAVSKADIAQMRGRFEEASGNLQQMLEEKDRTIRALDDKLHSMAKKLDPALVGQDDLSLIKGIGPYIKRILEKEFGIASFKQVVMMDKGQLEEISSRLFFKGKIQKEDWIAQAIELHLKKYDERLDNPRPPYRYHWVG